MGGKVEYFDLQLDTSAQRQRDHISPPDGVYFYPGQTLNGTVIISVKGGDVFAKSLQVHILGEAKTAWINKASDKIFETRQPYVDAKIDVPCGAGISTKGVTGNRSQIFPAESVDHGDLCEGVHAVQFSYKLALGIPPSFEGEFGYVRYTCTARLSAFSFDPQSLVCHPSSASDFKCEKLLTVVTGPENPPKFEQLARNECVREDAIELIGCCGRADRVDVVLTLSKGAYFVGETVQAKLHVRNRSRRRLRRISLALMQHSRFQAQSRYEFVNDQKEMNRMLDSVVIERQIGAESEDRCSADLRIGEMTPSMTSQLISVQHFVRLSIESMELNLPISVAWMLPH